jgi:hypothetical protein
MRVHFVYIVYEMIGTTILSRQQRRALMRKQAAKTAQHTGLPQELQFQHYLERPKSLAGLAVAGIWAAGAALLDSHIYVGLILCFIAITGTLWLYSSELRPMKLHPIAQWPWLPILFVFGEILIPGILWYGKSNEFLKSAVNYTFQSRGQIGATINNYGPVINAPSSSVRDDCPFSHNEIHAYSYGGGPDSTGIAIEGNGFCDNKFDLHASGRGHGIVIDPSGKSITRPLAAPSPSANGK